jgi:hypothetical protein
LRIGVGEERSRLNSSVFPSGEARMSEIMGSMKYEGGRRRGWPAEISGAIAWEDPIF